MTMKRKKKKPMQKKMTMMMKKTHEKVETEKAKEELG